MVCGLARNGGERHELLSAIRQKMASGGGARFRLGEALMVLEWAIECDESEDKKELLDIFDVMGGMALRKDALAHND